MIVLSRNDIDELPCSEVRDWFPSRDVIGHWLLIHPQLKAFLPIIDDDKFPKRRCLEFGKHT